MGKTLIIKGADFSENAILTNKWYNSYENLLGSEAYQVTHVCMTSDTVAELGLVGKPINAIRLYSNDNTNITVKKVKITENHTFEELTSYDKIPVSFGINVLVLPEPIVLSEGESLLLSNIKNIITCNRVSDDEQTHEGWIGFNRTSWLHSYRFPVEVGFIVDE